MTVDMHPAVVILLSFLGAGAIMGALWIIVGNICHNHQYGKRRKP